MALARAGRLSHTQSSDQLGGGNTTVLQSSLIEQARGWQGSDTSSHQTTSVLHTSLRGASNTHPKRGYGPVNKTTNRDLSPDRGSDHSSNEQEDTRMSLDTCVLKAELCYAWDSRVRIFRILKSYSTDAAIKAQGIGGHTVSASGSTVDWGLLPFDCSTCPMQWRCSRHLNAHA